MNIFVIPNLDDNHCYYVFNKDIKSGFFVDCGESSKTLPFIKQFGIEPKHVLNTHKHWDHTGGNKDLKAAFGNLIVHAGKHEGLGDHQVEDREVMEIAGMKIEARHVPCHTKGHMLYYVTLPDDDGKELSE